MQDLPSLFAVFKIFSRQMIFKYFFFFPQGHDRPPLFYYDIDNHYHDDTPAAICQAGIASSSATEAIQGWIPLTETK
ncbi:MAG: hypothetical protein PHG97_04305 [Candidatus Margulisbacteria bacterium]|nr:hypothetical protein [Candidatus Margulisiibacteriota bacterium]